MTQRALYDEVIKISREGAFVNVKETLYAKWREQIKEAAREGEHSVKICTDVARNGRPILSEFLFDLIDSGFDVDNYCSTESYALVQWDNEKSRK